MHKFMLSLAFAALAVPVLAQPAPEAITLKVMSFNVWYGGENVNQAAIAEVIRTSGADIVGLQETDGNLARLAAATGLVYYDTRRNIISRFPIFDPALGERTQAGPGLYSMPSLDSNAVHALIAVAPGQVIAMANTHLTSNPYGPEAVRDGEPLDAILAIEAETRLPEAQSLADALAPVIASGLPVFLTGDFNVPSWRDWTAEMTAIRPEVKYAVDWPVSRVMEQAGLTDSYRAVYPDAAQRPGLTWTPGAPYPLQPDDGTHDRIDYVWSATAKPVSSEIFGEVGGPDVDVGFAPYPSDHRAVLTTFEVTPAIAPGMIAVEPPRIVDGQNFILRASIPGLGLWSGVVVPRGGDATTDGLTGIANVGQSDRPTIKLSTIGLPPAPYDAVLLDESGAERARTRFTVVPAENRATLSLDKSQYTTGEAITASWTSALGLRFDWMAVYALPAPDVYDYGGYIYTGARVDGSQVLDADTLGDLPPGRYELRLFADDSYVTQAAAQFEITAP
ncbi:endonuclease/exonuclease/phosphatase family protein [Devosia sp. 2618]|uniref:endonuclease/exonuclease/phosphatase family protein n=1 Tax=Devosia sp. 2618 TaxID=3156454 RepID=UPI003398A1BD